MLLKHAASIIALPVTVMFLLPLLFIHAFHFVPFWGLTSTATAVPLVTGVLLISSGLILLLSTVSLFLSQGDGTIAPWSPTQSLITTGIYAYVRNPMMMGVFFVLIGESILIGSLSLTVFTIAFILVNLLYIPFIEEPTLSKRFGIDYWIYKENVPRWIPHFIRRNRSKSTSTAA